MTADRMRQAGQICEPEVWRESLKEFQNQPTASQRCDRSAVIWLQNTMAVRDKRSNRYDRGPGRTTMGIRSVTTPVPCAPTPPPTPTPDVIATNPHHRQPRPPRPSAPTPNTPCTDA